MKFFNPSNAKIIILIHMQFTFMEIFPSIHQSQKDHFTMHVIMIDVKLQWKEKEWDEMHSVDLWKFVKY